MINQVIPGSVPGHQYYPRCLDQVLMSLLLRAHKIDAQGGVVLGQRQRAHYERENNMYHYEVQACCEYCAYHQFELLFDSCGECGAICDCSLSSSFLILII